MTLAELAPEYECAAAQITARIRELERTARQTENAEERWRLRRRIAALRPMQRDTRALARMLAHYYEGGFYRNDEFTVRLSWNEAARRAATKKLVSRD